ncbi:MAG: hypothetical protein OXU20_13480, partial [Myxococcales bacterium]|nr:hypothetical protein [Myxococcales bacterium]
MRASIVVCALLLIACGRSLDSAPAAPHVAEPAPAPPPREAAPITEADMAPHLPDHMRDHFRMVTAVRDAVIRGQLEQAQPPLIWLAQHSYAGEVPDAWKPFVDGMQLTARKAQEAGSTSELAAHVARLGSACGACHGTLAKPVAFGPAGYERLLDEDKPEQVLGRMHRHLWAAERMWEGLVAPDAERFQAAALVLLDSPSLKGASDRVRAGADAVRALGKRARTAEQLAQRVDVFGEFLGQCSRCHQEHGVVPGQSGG